MMSVPGPEQQPTNPGEEETEVSSPPSLPTSTGRANGVELPAEFDGLAPRNDRRNSEEPGHEPGDGERDASDADAVDREGDGGAAVSGDGAGEPPSVPAAPPAADEPPERVSETLSFPGLRASADADGEQQRDVSFTGVVVVEPVDAGSEAVDELSQVWHGKLAPFVAEHVVEFRRRAGSPDVVSAAEVSAVAVAEALAAGDGRQARDAMRTLSRTLADEAIVDGDAAADALVEYVNSHATLTEVVAGLGRSIDRIATMKNGRYLSALTTMRQSPAHLAELLATNDAMVEFLQVARRCADEAARQHPFAALIHDEFEDQLRYAQELRAESTVWRQEREELGEPSVASTVALFRLVDRRQQELNEQLFEDMDPLTFDELELPNAAERAATIRSERRAAAQPGEIVESEPPRVGEPGSSGVDAIMASIPDNVAELQAENDPAVSGPVRPVLAVDIPRLYPGDGVESVVGTQRITFRGGADAEAALAELRNGLAARRVDFTGAYLMAHGMRRAGPDEREDSIEFNGIDVVPLQTPDGSPMPPSEERQAFFHSALTYLDEVSAQLNTEFMSAEGRLLMVSGMLAVMPEALAGTLNDDLRAELDVANDKTVWLALQDRQLDETAMSASKPLLLTAYDHRMNRIAAALDGALDTDVIDRGNVMSQLKEAREGAFVYLLNRSDADRDKPLPKALQRFTDDVDVMLGVLDYVGEAITPERRQDAMMAFERLRENNVFEAVPHVTAEAIGNKLAVSQPLLVRVPQPETDVVFEMSERSPVLRVEFPYLRRARSNAADLLDLVPEDQQRSGSSAVGRGGEEEAEEESAAEPLVGATFTTSFDMGGDEERLLNDFSDALTRVFEVAAGGRSAPGYQSHPELEAFNDMLLSGVVDVAREIDDARQGHSTVLRVAELFTELRTRAVGDTARSSAAADIGLTLRRKIDDVTLAHTTDEFNAGPLLPDPTPYPRAEAEDRMLRVQEMYRTLAMWEAGVTGGISEQLAQLVESGDSPASVASVAARLVGRAQAVRDVVSRTAETQFNKVALLRGAEQAAALVDGLQLLASNEAAAVDELPFVASEAGVTDTGLSRIGGGTVTDEAAVVARYRGDDGQGPDPATNYPQRPGGQPSFDDYYDDDITERSELDADSARWAPDRDDDPEEFWREQRLRPRRVARVASATRDANGFAVTRVAVERPQRRRAAVDQRRPGGTRRGGRAPS